MSGRLTKIWLISFLVCLLALAPIVWAQSAGGALLGGVPSAPSPFLLVQEGYADTSGDNSFTFTSNNTVGHHIQLGIYLGNGVSLAAGGACATSSPCDSKGNTYVQDVTATDGAGEACYIFHADNIAAGPNTVYIHVTSNANDNELDLSEWAGVVTSSSLDKEVSAVGNSSSPDSGNTAMTTQASELIFGYMRAQQSNPGTFAAGSGYTAVNSASGISELSEYKTVASEGTYNSTTSVPGSSYWCQLTATYK